MTSLSRHSHSHLSRALLTIIALLGFARPLSGQG